MYVVICFKEFVFASKLWRPIAWIRASTVFLFLISALYYSARHVLDPILESKVQMIYSAQHPANDLQRCTRTGARLHAYKSGAGACGEHLYCRDGPRAEMLNASRKSVTGLHAQMINRR